MRTFQLSFDSLKNFNPVTQNQCVTYNLPNSLKKISKIHLKSIEFPTNQCTNIVTNVTDQIYFTYDHTQTSTWNWVGHSEYGVTYPVNKMWLTLQQQNYSNILYLLTDLNWYSTHFLKTNIVYDMDINGYVCILLSGNPHGHIIQGCLDYYNNNKYYTDYSDTPIADYPEAYEQIPTSNIANLGTSTLYFFLTTKGGGGSNIVIDGLTVDVFNTGLTSIIDSLNSQISDYVSGLGVTYTISLDVKTNDQGIYFASLNISDSDLSDTGVASFTVQGALLTWLSLDQYITFSVVTNSEHVSITLNGNRKVLPFTCDPIVLNFIPTQLSTILGFPNKNNILSSSNISTFTYYKLDSSQVVTKNHMLIGRATLKPCLFYNSFFTMYIKNYGNSNSGDGSNNSFKIMNPYSSLPLAPSTVSTIQPYIQMNDETSMKQFIITDPNIPIQKLEIYFYDRFGNNMFLADGVPYDVSMTLQFESHE